jgi:hypothetical protein
MYPDATASALQTGQLALRQQGDLMNWKKVLSDLAFWMAVMFVNSMLVYWPSRASHFNSEFFINDALSATALAFGIVGFGELRRGGHQRIGWIGRIFTFIWMVVTVGMIAPPKTTAFDYVADGSICLAFLPFAAIFPIALYLNRNHKNSGSRPTTDNAS